MLIHWRSWNLLRNMVGPGGLEPLTSSVSRKRSNQLSYGPISVNDYLKLLAELPALICTESALTACQKVKNPVRPWQGK